VDEAARFGGSVAVPGSPLDDISVVEKDIFCDEG
jgi:hypothetical protein